MAFGRGTKPTLGNLTDRKVGEYSALTVLPASNFLVGLPLARTNPYQEVLLKQGSLTYFQQEKESISAVFLQNIVFLINYSSAQSELMLSSSSLLLDKASDQEGICAGALKIMHPIGDNRVQM